MKKHFLHILLLFLVKFSEAQIVNGNAFIKGQFIEVGINQCGGFGSTANAPAGYHARSGIAPGGQVPGPLKLGFVADPEKNGWTTGTPNRYNGDYFLPSGPLVGWGISFNGINRFSERSAPGLTVTACPVNSFAGSVTTVQNTATESFAIWQGTNSGLALKKTTTIKSDKLYFTVKVDLANTSAVAINNIFYGDYVNPDNDAFYQDVYAGFLGTRNEIQFQNPTDEKALVASYGQRLQTYLGLGSKDCRANVLRSHNFGIQFVPDVSGWNAPTGSHTLTGSEPGPDNGGIGICFTIGTILPGDSTSFTYTYILNETDFEEALAETETLVANNATQYNSGDTIYACSGTNIPLSLVNGNNYTWNWSATAGSLGNTGGLTNSFTVPATEAIINIDGTSACGNKQISIRVIPANASINAPTIIQPTCLAPQGSVTINATSFSAIEYSINNGVTWQLSNVFNGLTTGPYNIAVRSLTAPFCITNYAGNPVLITNNALPSVNPPQSQVVCNGNNTTAIIFAGSPVNGTIYNWTNDNPSIGLAAAGTGNINSFVAINNSTQPLTANISVAASVGSCNSTAQNFTITINPTALVNSVNDQTICANTSTGMITFSGNINGTIYNWVNDNPSIGLAAAGTGNINSFTALNNGTSALLANISVTPVYSNAGQTCSGAPIQFVMNVLPAPVMDAISDESVCSGETVTAIQFNSNIAGTQFTWTNNNPAIGLGTNGSGNINAFTAVNNSSVPVTASITASAALQNGSLSCYGADEIFIITVNPLPAVNTVMPVAACNGDFTGTIDFTGNIPGAVYQWQNNNTSIGIAASGTGDIASFMAQNNSENDITSNITVSATTNGCTGASTSFPVTVYASPKLGADKTIFICEDSTANLTTLYNNSGISMNYFSGAATVANPTAVNTGTYLLTGTNVNNCKDSVLITIENYAAISLQVFSNPPAGNTIIEGQPVQLNATGVGITEYNWSPAASLSAPASASTSALPGSSTRYFISVKNNGGCTDTASVLINVIPLDITPSSGFTPNGDGYTEKWVVKNIQYAKSSQLVIFNRLGNKVYEAGNYQNNWDGTFKGKPLPDGAYYYQLKIITANNKTIEKSGSITLLR